MKREMWILMNALRIRMVRRRKKAWIINIISAICERLWEDEEHEAE